jgi:hypothetical protein
VATISSAGFVTGVALGTTIIQASTGAINGSTTLTVNGGFVPTGSMNIPRENFTATRLSNGKVLIVGGATVPAQCPPSCGASGYDPSAEIYDPTTGTFSFTGSLNIPRVLFTATLLSDGRVLIAGGFNNIDPTTGNVVETGAFPVLAAEIYDPTTGIFTPTGSLNTGRFGDTATLLNNGKVLIAGGSVSLTSTAYIATAEIYDPTAGIFTPTGSMTQSRYAHTTTLLSNGSVLIAGGYSGGDVALSTGEIYDPMAGIFTPTGNMTTARVFHTATLLNNGQVLIAGGVTVSL